MMSSQEEPKTLNKGEEPNMTSGEPKKETTGHIGGFKLMLLALMVVQNSSTVLVGRYTRSSVPKDELFIVNHLVLVTEIAKVSCFGDSGTASK